jgi:protein-S-isoprenylcysteine O-methyltransferase Ste14
MFEIGVWNAWLFMTVFVVQMIVMMLADKSVLERSHVPNEAKRNVVERSGGIVGNVAWFAAIGYSIFVPLQLGSAWFYVGLIVFVLGVVLMTVATRDFMTTPADRLIAKGVYRFSRHPMYLATTLICLGSGIAGASWLLMLLSVILAACLYAEALVEERHCLEEYGSAYRAYQERVPRWLGFPRR